ncbi:MAG: ABC transporter ATP-binding protein, partial [Spirochaetes bacterium]
MKANNIPLLQVKDLCVEYHIPAGVFKAVDKLSFNLEKGKSLGIVGESGCGKTTAMLALLRLLPESGRIVEGEVLLEVEGEQKDILRLPPSELKEFRWNKIAMVFQGAMNALNPVRTVGSQIREALILHNSVPKNKVEEEIELLLDLVGVSPAYKNRYPHQYSGGMRQRAMIAMALACRPDVLIADEPTTALDMMVQAQILDLLKKLQHELDLAVVMVTHDLGAVADLCDDVLVMYAGMMAELAPVETIFEKPVHPYTRRLISAFPDINNPKAELASIPGYPPALNKLPKGCRFEPRCELSTDKCILKIPDVIEVSKG